MIGLDPVAPPRPSSVSAPPPPDSTLLPLFPVIVLALSFPVPLMFSVPVRSRRSTFAARAAMVTLDCTVSKPAEKADASMITSPVSSTI